MKCINIITRKVCIIVKAKQTITHEWGNKRRHAGIQIECMEQFIEIITEGELTIVEVLVVAQNPGILLSK